MRAAYAPISASVGHADGLREHSDASVTVGDGVAAESATPVPVSHPEQPADFQRLVWGEHEGLCLRSTPVSEWRPPADCVLPMSTDDEMAAYLDENYGLHARPMAHQLRGVRELVQYNSKRLLRWPPRAGKTLTAILVALLRFRFAPEYEGARSGRVVLIATPTVEVACISWYDTCLQGFFRDFSAFADVHVVHHRSELVEIETWKSNAAARGVDVFVLCTYHHLRDHYKDVLSGIVPHVVGCPAYDKPLLSGVWRAVDAAETFASAWDAFVHAIDHVVLRSSSPLIDLIILDEVQRCLSITSQTGRALRLMLASVPPHCRFFLSGTPAGNRPHEDRASMCQLAAVGERTFGVAPNNVSTGTAPMFWDPTTPTSYPDQLTPQARALLREMDCAAKETEVFQVRASAFKLRRVKPEKVVECVELTQTEWDHYLCEEYAMCQKARVGLAAARRTQGARRSAAATGYIAGVARLEYGFVSTVAGKPEFVEHMRKCWASPTFPEHKALRAGGPPRCQNPACDRHNAQVMHVQYKTCRDIDAHHYLCADCVAMEPPTCPRCDDILASCRSPGGTKLRPARLGKILVPTTSLMARVIELLHAHVRIPKGGKAIVTVPRKADAVECMLLMERHGTLPVGRSAVIFDGDVDGIAMLRKFKECDAVRVMLAVPEKICEGLDLSVADLLIKTTVQWCQSKDEQLNARITGHMQSRKPRVVQLVVPGTICEAKLWNNEGCARLTRAVLGGEKLGSVDFCRALGHLNLIIAARPISVPKALVLKTVRTRSETMDDVLMDLEDELSD